MVLICLLASGVARAARIGVGASRAEVIAALGEPVGRSSTGSREVLIYPDGRVFLREGRVEELDAALVPAEIAPPHVEEPAPSPQPPPPPAPAVAEAPAPAPEGHAWIKPALIVVFLGLILLLGRHWMRVAKRAQEAKRDLLSR